MPKPSPLKALFMAQFFSAFVDNMILFIVLAVIKRDAYPDYYLPFVQSTFLASYIILSPWVGRLADKKPKARILILGNLVKVLGVLCLSAGLNPALSYAVVGLGAVIYSPAKYGILPFLTRGEDELLRANSGLESYTILAILTGSIAGGFLSDISVPLALAICLLLYGLSIGINTIIPKNPGQPGLSYKNALGEFRSDVITLFKEPQSHYSLVGTGSFWLTSAVLRMIILVWIPLVLGIQSGTFISLIIAATGIGIAAGAAVTPYLIGLQTYRRTVWFGYALAGCIVPFLFIHSLAATVLFLFLIGVFGGIYIVPMNACLQQVGQRTVGEGKTIAVQNFLENSFMFAGVGLYTLAAKNQVATSAAIGATCLVFVLLVSYLHLLAKRDKTSGRSAPAYNKEE